jgi:hypothetical protein
VRVSLDESERLEGSEDTAFDLASNGHDMQLGNDSGTSGDPVWVTPGMP